MNNLKLKLTTSVVTTAFLVGLVLPTGAFAANTVTVSGNGAGSTNKVKIKNTKKVRVEQSNRTAVINLVGVFQNTGGNSANQNTGGDVTVNSGNATANVTNTTTTGGNTLVVPDCGCPDPVNTVDVKDNGADSTNTVKITNKSKTVVSQSNETLVVNGVLVGQNTGNNEANQNTGGTVSVDSGNASATVNNTTTTGDNLLTPSI